MKFLRPLVLLLLLALWLPATLHCALEYAGIVTHGSLLPAAVSSGEKSLLDCDHDAGKVLQSQLLLDLQSITVPGLKLLGLLFCVVVPFLLAASRVLLIVRLRLDHAPPSRLADLYFVLRAAPLARAPALV